MAGRGGRFDELKITGINLGPFVSLGGVGIDDVGDHGGALFLVVVMGEKSAEGNETSREDFRDGVNVMTLGMCVKGTAGGRVSRVGAERGSNGSAKGGQGLGRYGGGFAAI